MLFNTVCPDPPTTGYSKYQVTYKTADEVWLPGTTVHSYECDKFHEMAGAYPEEITCQDDGTWDHTEPPVCEPSKLAVIQAQAENVNAKRNCLNSSISAELYAYGLSRGYDTNALGQNCVIKFEKGGNNLCDETRGIGVAILDPITRTTQSMK